MCRSIKQLRPPYLPYGAVEPSLEPATDEEIAAAALQFVRKVSGYRAPSRANQAAFDAAVADIARATSDLLAALQPVPAVTRAKAAATQD
jgi:hypothetical protein